MEFNLAPHNMPTCPENSDSARGIAEPKKRGPNSALMYGEEWLQSAPVNRTGGLALKQLPAGGLMAACECHAVYVPAEHVPYSTQQRRFSLLREIRRNGLIPTQKQN